MSCPMKRAILEAVENYPRLGFELRSEILRLIERTDVTPYVKLADDDCPCSRCEKEDQ